MVKRSRDETAGGAGTAVLTTGSPTAPASDASPLRLAPESLWRTVVDGATWADYGPPSGRQFLQALQLRQQKMKRPTPDLLFDGGGGGASKLPPSSVSSASTSEADRLEFRSSSFVGGQWDATNAALAASTHERVVHLMQWKLQRGLFRPGLLQQLQSNSAADVLAAVHKAHRAFDEAVTAAASPRGCGLSWEALGRVSMDAVRILCSLRGVGPATASLILSRFVFDGHSHCADNASVVKRASSSDACGTVGLRIAPAEGRTVADAPAISLTHGIVPFFGDEAAATVLQVPISKLKYTLGELTQFTMRVWEKYDELMRHASTQVGRSAAAQLQPADLPHCLWAAATLQKYTT